MNSRNPLRRAASRLLIVCGVWLVGLGFYFIAVRPPLLPEDLRYMAVTSNQVSVALPALESWLDKVFTVLGGFIAGAGVLTFFLASTIPTHRPKTASWTIACSGALTVGLMSATNFALGSDFRWLLLTPALLWMMAFVLHISSAGTTAASNTAPH